MICSLSREKIPGEVRFGWLKQIYKDIKNVNGSKALWAILNERGNERLKMNLANALETLIENHGSELVFAG